MQCRIQELDDLRVSVDRVVFAPDLDAPEDRPFPFIYFITINNDSKRAVTIRGRKWVVTDAEGNRIVVEGDGVVGKMPHLSPGETFSYNSYHVIGSDSIAEGALFGVTDDGDAVMTRIPTFKMTAPCGS